MKKYSISFIFLIIFSAIAVGCLLQYTQNNSISIACFSVFDVIGNLFINALTLVVIPLICSSIITGIIKLGENNSFSRIGKKVFILFISINLLAIIFGFIVTKIFNKPLLFSAQFLTPSSNANSINFSIVDIFSKLIPTNIFQALANGQMLGIIFFSIVFGYAITLINKDLSATLNNFFSAIFQVMIKTTHLIMWFLPVGIFCLIAKNISNIGLDAIKPLLIFLSISIFAILFYSFFIIPLLLKCFDKNIKIINHIKSLFPALVTAFATSSSSASLTIALDCVEKKLLVPKKISNLVLPLGCSLNMAASALYCYLASYFILLLNNIPITLPMQLILIFLTLLSTMGIAGIPSGAIIAIIIILKGINISTAGFIGFFLAIDRVIDMFRTSGNVFIFCTSCVIITKSEKEKNVLQEN